MSNLEGFLFAYGVELDDTYEIRFAKRWMKVYRWDRDKDGQRFVGSDNEPATRKPVTFQYRSGLTPKVH